MTGFIARKEGQHFRSETGGDAVAMAASIGLEFVSAPSNETVASALPPSSLATSRTMPADPIFAPAAVPHKVLARIISQYLIASGGSVEYVIGEFTIRARATALATFLVPLFFSCERAMRAIPFDIIPTVLWDPGD
jgi:hypothetical protein